MAPKDAYETRSPELPRFLLSRPPEGGLPATLCALRLRASYGAYSSTPSNDEGGRRKGEGAREGVPECMLSVRRPPRKGLVDGVKENSVLAGVLAPLTGPW